MSSIALYCFATVLLDLPMLMIAILTDSKYFFVLSWIAFASQASTVAWLMTSNDLHPTYIYVGLANVVVLALFMCLYRCREGLHRRLVRWLTACARHTCAVETFEDDNDDGENYGSSDEMNTTTAGLLQPNVEAEEA